MSIKRSDDSVPEFVFGNLSTSEGRTARAAMAQEGFYHDLLLEPPDPRPGDDVTVTVHAGAHVTIDTATLYYTIDNSTPDPLSATTAPTPTTPNPVILSEAKNLEAKNLSQANPTYAIPMQRSTVDWDTLTWSYTERWTAVIPVQSDGTHVHYIIEGVTPDGDTLRSPHIPPPPFSVTEEDQLYHRLTLETRSRMAVPRIYAYVVDNVQPPQWLQEAIIYQIFVDRFAPDSGKQFKQPPDRSGFYGGTLAGIRSKLDYLADLGVTCLWLTPIFPTPSHHGYDATDYGAIEPRLGDLDEFEQLAQDAHDRGMRIVLDYVANHISNEHPAFQQTHQDRDADTSAWFRFDDWPDSYDTFLGVQSMPRLETDDAGARAYLIDNACRWLERCADGFRLDHAHGATHAFWSAFRQATRATKPDSATFGEITDTPNVVRTFAGRMDGALDFGLLEALRGFFAFHSLKPREFDRFLRRHFAFYADSLVLPSFLDNHDMNRFLYSVGGDVRRLKLAALCQFTLPGPPILYYGSEVGLSQLKPADPLEEARLPMLWGDEQDHVLLGFYRNLIALRKAGGSVWREPRRTLLADDKRGLYIYACGELVVALNNSEDSVGARISLADGEPQLHLSTDNDVRYSVETSIVSMPPYAGAVIGL